jgi:hypothetical protein
VFALIRLPAQLRAGPVSRSEPAVEQKDDRVPDFDVSAEAMRRLRFPFDGKRADVIEPRRQVSADRDDDRAGW